MMVFISYTSRTDDEIVEAVCAPFDAGDILLNIIGNIYLGWVNI